MRKYEQSQPAVHEEVIVLRCLDGVLRQMEMPYDQPKQGDTIEITSCGGVAHFEFDTTMLQEGKPYLIFDQIIEPIDV